MAGPSSVKNVLKRLLGGETLPQPVTVAIREPQGEIAVWLQGAGGSREVTHLHSIACASPFAVCLSFGSMEEIKKEYGGRKVSLVVRESGWRGSWGNII